jgi:hypothetical protein
MMVRRAAAALISLASLAAAGCGSGGSPAAPPSTQGELSDASAPPEDASLDAGVFAICPPGLDASFNDLLTRVMATTGCGTNNQASCHSTRGASNAGDFLDFTLDASAVYHELVGVKSANVSSVSGVQPLRVAPGDAGASLLYIKLTLKTLGDPNYGAGMPQTAPGSVCPEALDAFKTWIDQGAKP